MCVERNVSCGCDSGLRSTETSSQLRTQTCSQLTPGGEDVCAFHASASCESFSEGGATTRCYYYDRYLQPKLERGAPLGDKRKATTAYDVTVPVPRTVAEAFRGPLPVGKPGRVPSSQSPHESLRSDEIHCGGPVADCPSGTNIPREPPCVRWSLAPGPTVQPDKSQSQRYRRDSLKILSLLGEGALGRVYLARCLDSKKLVALKMISKQRAGQPGIKHQVFQERSALLQLRYHPNVVLLEASFQDKNFLYFILEYISGGTLADVLQRCKLYINPSLCHLWVADIVQVLCALRQHCILHGDIKGENILLDSERRLRLIDFNSSEKLEINEASANGTVVVKLPAHSSSPPQPSATRADCSQSVDAYTGEVASDVERPATVLKSIDPLFVESNSSAASSRSDRSAVYLLGGTLHNLAPEVAIHCIRQIFPNDENVEKIIKDWSNRSLTTLDKGDFDVLPLQNSKRRFAEDIWSAGCVIYQIACRGMHPFKAATPLETFKNILDNNLSFPEFVSSTCQDLIRRMLATKPQQRLGYSSVGTLKSHPWVAKFFERGCGTESQTTNGSGEEVTLHNAGPPSLVEESSEVPREYFRATNSAAVLYQDPRPPLVVGGDIGTSSKHRTGDDSCSAATATTVSSIATTFRSDEGTFCEEETSLDSTQASYN